MSTEPRGDDRLLGSAQWSSSGNRVDRHIWWRTPASFSSVVAFLKNHRPPGTRAQGSGREGGPGVPRNETLSFGLPLIRGVVSSRSLLFWVVALRGGGTAVRVDGEDIWIVPRPASEQVPAGVHEVDITSARPHKPPIVSVSVSTPAKVRRIVTLLDGMETVQPGVWNCPALLGGQPVVTFDFRTRASGPLLAKVTLTDYGFPSYQCNPIDFSIRGHPQKPLLGGNFLTQVERLLGVRFR